MEKEQQIQSYRPVSLMANAPVDPIIDLRNLDLCDDCKSKLLAEFLRTVMGIDEIKGRR